MVAVAVCALASAGCELVVADGPCARPAEPEHTLNQLPQGAQILGGPRALGALPNGSAMAAFVTVGEAGAGDELRVVRMGPDGARSLTTCDDDRERTVWPRVGDVAVGEIQGMAFEPPLAIEEVGALVWTTAQGDHSVQIAGIDTRVVCEEPESVGVDLAPPGSSPTTIAVTRTDVGQYLVLWTEGDATAALSARAVWLLPRAVPRFLPVRDGVDGTLVTDRPARIVTFDGVPSSVRAASLGDGRIAVAAFVLRSLVWEVQLAVLDVAGGVMVPAFAVSAPAEQRAAGSDVGIAFDGAQVLVTWTELDAANAAPRLMGRLLTPAGDFLRAPSAPDGEPFVLSAIGAQAANPTVVARAGGGFFVAYARAALGGSTEARAIALLGLDPEGERQFLVPACERAEALVTRPGVFAYGPSMATLSSGALAIAWTATELGGVDSDASGIAARVYTPHALLPGP